jgi:DNA polymerase-1
MTYMVMDSETETRVHLKRKASRWHPDNYVVAHGWKFRGDKQCSYEYFDGPGDNFIRIPENVTLLVGFNLKFDMLWQWDNPDLQAFFKRGGKIWDCQYAEYLIHGMNQTYHYADLNSTAPKYGGTEKIDEVKVLWDAGYQSSEINKDLLLDYLVGTKEEDRNGGDIGNTEKIFLGQLKKATDLGMMKALCSRMDGLCSTTEMEYNGLKIDVVEAKKQLVQLTKERKEAREKLSTFIPDLPEHLEFKWSSRVHKSCLIFGGTVKYKKQDTYLDENTGELARFVVQRDHWVLEDGTTTLIKDESKPPENAVRFKGGKNKGQPKTKKVKGYGELKTKYQDFYFTFDGYTRGLPEWHTKTRDAAGDLVYSTNGDTIAALENSGVPFCEVLVRYEALDKEINTYFLSRDKDGKVSGMLSCVDPRDHIVHHSLNHCATVTARLSSNNPNLQNIPRADKSNLKRVFYSRFGENGLMLEADYSQLEVVVQGVLSGDTQLLKDLRSKIDFHCKRVSIQPKYSITYDEVLAIIKDEDHPQHSFWKAIRTSAKIFSFQRAYGAGAPLIAAFTGMTIDEVKELIVADEATYPGIVDFNRDVAEKVQENVKWFHDHVNEGKFRMGTWQSPTGCLYSFRSWPAKDWQLERGIEESFSPTEMKNYPTQGTGGEIVQGICGKLWRHFVANDNYGGKAVLCNTVHDCVWVDCHKDVASQVAQDVKRIMESVDDWFLQFGVEITVPFPVEVEMGPNMLELKHVT